MALREVRVESSFFERLDEQLGESRGPNGEPSSTDFLLFDLPTILDRFAKDFDQLPRINAEHEAFRFLVGSGALVRGFVVAAELGGDGVVSLYSIELELTP